MERKILDYIDFEKVNVLLEGFNQSTGFVTAILDLNGEILSKSGWRQACTEFHRKNPETAKRCSMSDTVLASKIREGESYHCYKCLNGLVDVAVPIIIAGKQIATLFSGQFFFEAPDESFFRKQAREYGFDEETYMRSILEIPVISEEKVKTIMQFLLNMTQLISHMTLQKLELLNLNEELRLSKERYRLVLENSMDAILLTTEEGSVLSANKAACKMFKRTEQEILLDDLRRLTDDNKLCEFKDECERNGKVQGEMLMLRSDGDKFPAELSISVFEDTNGQKRSSIIIRDITERKITEDQLIKEKEKAEESDRLKTAFLQNMSHEIRTPMNAIMGFSGLMKDHNTDKQKIRHYSEIIYQRCDDLLSVINDLLDIAKIESGQVQLTVDECNINRIFEEISDSFAGYRKKAGKQHIPLYFKQFPIQENAVFYTDKLKLKQIIINLISNAYKFTDSGKIEVGYSLENNDHLSIYVTDTGMGIPADKLSSIFDRFTQLHQLNKKNLGGTGLGLSIVKGLVDLLGGEIVVHSEPGKGSTFIFNVRCMSKSDIQQNESEKAESIALKYIGTKSILIAEDDEYNAEYLKEALSGTGFNILMADSGESAIEICMKQPVDFILMDIRLPGIDGYEATRLILKEKPHIKVIAQTAYATPQEKQKALSEGCIDYISKPTRQDLLLQMLQKHSEAS